MQFIQKNFYTRVIQFICFSTLSVKPSTRISRIFSMSSGSWMWIGWSLGLITISHYRCQCFLMSNNIKYSDRSRVTLHCLTFLLGQSWLYTTGKHQCGRPRLIPTVYQRRWGQTELHYHLWPYVSLVKTSNPFNYPVSLHKSLFIHGAVLKHAFNRDTPRFFIKWNYV